MSAFFVFHSTVYDMAEFQKYAKAVPSTLEPFGGNVVMKGKLDHAVETGDEFENVAVLEFPDLDQANAWYRSQAYQSLISTRNSAAKMKIAVYQRV